MWSRAHVPTLGISAIAGRSVFCGVLSHPRRSPRRLQRELGLRIRDDSGQPVVASADLLCG